MGFFNQNDLEEVIHKSKIELLKMECMNDRSNLNK